MNGADEPVVATARRRLRRIQGQLNGILAMIEEGRSCEEVIQQIAGAGKALDRVGVSLLVSQLQHCIETTSTPGSRATTRTRSSGSS